MKTERLEPLNWFVGLKNTSLQLLVYGNDLQDVKLSSNIPSAKIVGSNRTSQDLAIFTIDLSDVSHAGTFDLTFTNDRGETLVEKYSLLDKKSYQKQEFNASDSIYLIMPDRFDTETNNGLEDIDRSNPNGWHGGTINGIINRLDYLKNLGITSLWHTPVFKNGGPVETNGDKSEKFFPYHGYAITDFYGIDKHFGTFEDYVNFVAVAHGKGLKVIKDIVFNHCSIGHKWYASPLLKNWFNNLESKQNTNYDTTSIFGSYCSKEYKKQTVKGWFTPYMVDLNLECDELLTYMTQMTIWWIEMTGIDAFRMDTYQYADHKSMLKWQRSINNEYPGFPIIAETWVNETAYTAETQKRSRNSLRNNPLIVMDFAFQKHLWDAFHDREKGAEIMYNHFLYDFLYKYPQQTMAFIDNHDLPRFLSEFSDFKDIKLALGLLLTVPRIPQILYGTEILLEGEGWSEGDGFMRSDFPWDWDNEYRNPIERGKRNQMLNFVKTILAFRNENPHIFTGDVIHFRPDENNNIYAFVRECKNRKERQGILVLANFSKKDVTLDMNKYSEVTKKYKHAVDIIEDINHTQLLKDTLIINKQEIKIINLY